MPELHKRSNAAEKIIVVKRFKKGKKEISRGQWKMAYADFMTAMMVFFLVMWIVNILPASQKDGIAGYFKDPGRISSKQNQNDTKSPSDLQSAEKLNKDLPENARIVAKEEKSDIQKMQELRQSIDEIVKNNSALIGMNNGLIVVETPEGLNIILTEKNKPMFNLGGNSMVDSTRQVLSLLGKPLANSGFEIKIEGHTDSLGYKSGSTYTNWELASDRANAARRALLVGGLPEMQVSQVIGYADRIPLVPEDTTDASNRRISIIALLPKFAEVIQDSLGNKKKAAESRANKKPAAQ